MAKEVKRRIPPDAVLIFEMELPAITDAPKEQPTREGGRGRRMGRHARECAREPLLLR